MITSNNWVWSVDALRLLVKITAYSSPLIAIDIWMQRTGDLLIPAKITLLVQCCLYTTMLVAIIVLGFSGTGEFIYFQF